MTKGFDLGQFFYVTQDCMIVAGTDGYFKAVNPAFTRLLEYSEAELLARPYIEFIHPDDVQTTIKEADQLARGIPMENFEHRFITQSGSVVWLSWRCTPFEDKLFATGRDITKFKRAKSDLDLLGRQLETILNSAPVALFTFDPQGQITLSVGKLLQKLHLQQNETVGVNMFDYNADRPEVIDCLRRALDGETVTLQNKVGEIYFESTYSPVIGEDGVVQEVIGVSTDITDAMNARQRAALLKEHELRIEFEKKFQETFDYTGVGIAHTSLQGEILTVNREFCNLLGFEPSTLIGSNYLQYSRKEGTGKETFRQNIFGNEASNRFVHERLIFRNDGSEMWILLTASAVNDEKGQPKYYILAHKDISERKSIEMSLRTSEQNFRSLADTIPQMVWTANAVGEVDYYNGYWNDYLVPSSGPGIRDAMRAALHPEDRKNCIELWERALSSGRPFESECRFFRHSDQTYRTHLGRALPILDLSGNIVRWFGTWTDIQDQKVAEEERSQSLIREQVALENARLKSEFMAIMSHEIRTPLNSVIGMTEILLGTQLDPEQKECAETVRTSSEALLTLVNDVLDFSKIEAGKLNFESIRFDLHKLADDVAKEILWRANEKRVHFEIDLAPSVPRFVLGDPTRLRQVLTNLVSNAVKFTHQGIVSLRLYAESQSQNTINTYFEVEDTGIGIKESDLQRIFKPFTQVDSSTNRNYGGTGLGLSICEKIVRLLNGDISAESELGKGSVFRFWIPFSLPLDADLLEANPTPITQIRWSRTPHILVAEDLVPNQKVMTFFLQKLGCRATIANDGVQVLELLDKGKYDLVLMDCQMPKLNGYETTKLIRQRTEPDFREIPIIATTANAVSSDRARCLEIGMNDYLSKPIRMDELSELLKKHLI